MTPTETQILALQDQIATQLGVSQSTIRDDLVNLVVPTKSKPIKTATNPKGAGRPELTQFTPTYRWLIEAVELMLRAQLELREELRNNGILR